MNVASSIMQEACTMQSYFCPIFASAKPTAIYACQSCLQSSSAVSATRIDELAQECKLQTPTTTITTPTPDTSSRRPCDALCTNISWAVISYEDKCDDPCLCVFFWLQEQQRLATVDAAPIISTCSPIVVNWVSLLQSYPH